MLPPYVILETEQAVEYFVDHLENMVNAGEFLAEVLHDLFECMDDWSNRNQGVRDHIEYLLYEHGFIENSETECALIRDCIWKVADSIVDNVLRHELTAFGAFPYRYHQMLGNDIVLIRADIQDRMRRTVGGRTYSSEIYPPNGSDQNT